MTTLRCCLALLALCATGFAQAARTAWLREARFGVFMHYLAEEQARTAAEWNHQIDAFDVDALAKQLASVEARYFCITLGQNSGYYLSPNAAYDRLVGISPSKCSRRDLVLDLYRALEPRGIRLMVYLPAGAPELDEAAVQKLEWKKGPYRNREFQLKWEQVIKEWSVRWGTRVKGWWFDGCFWPNTMYRTADPPNFETLAAAARAGNRDSIVAFNSGVGSRILSVSPYEDFTAGEVDDVERAIAGKQDGAQLHMLSFLGPRWGHGDAPRYPDARITAWSAALAAKGVVITYDVPRRLDGTIPQPFLDQLRRIAEAIRSSPAN